jgi:hypothetical protein
MFPHSSNSIFPKAMAVRNALWSCSSWRNLNSRRPAAPSPATAPSTSPASAYLRPRQHRTSITPASPWISALSRWHRAPSYSIAKFSCPAGQAIAFELSAMDDTSPTYFQDYASSPLACTFPLARAVLMHRRGCDQAIQHHLPQSDIVIFVARSRQVCIYWLWKHCLLLPILPGEGQIHIHIGNPVGREPVSYE